MERAEHFMDADDIFGIVCLENSPRVTAVWRRGSEARCVHGCPCPREVLYFVAIGNGMIWRQTGLGRVSGLKGRWLDDSTLTKLEFPENVKLEEPFLLVG